MGKLCSIVYKGLSLVNELYKCISSFIKKHPIEVALSLFALSSFLYMLVPSSPMLVFMGVTFASIYTALKYRLDVAEYNREIFGQRYECYSVIAEAFEAWEAGGIIGGLPKLRTVSRKSYYLFDKATYEFISRFKDSISNEDSRRRGTSVGTDESKEADENFLKSITQKDKYGLQKKFYELKIDTY